MLDLCNAFGSLPHAVLEELFASLPILSDLRRLLHNIYSNNTAYGDDLAVISTTPEELQGRLEFLAATAAALGLEFNPGKCVRFFLKIGKAIVADHITISGGRIR